MKELSLDLLGEEAMVDLGVELAASIANGGVFSGAVIFLEGDLGMGKTTLSRGVLNGFGYQGAVKSPTYTLVEPYEFEQLTIYHFDLYRLGDPEELEYMGIRDYFDTNDLCLVEWAEKGAMFLPKPDLVVRIGLIDGGRVVRIAGQSEQGHKITARLSDRLGL